MDQHQDFPDQKRWLEMCSPKEEADFVIGAVLYEEATGEGSRVFTLRQARRYTLDGLYKIQHYMIISDKTDILHSGKAAISFENILKAIEEHYPPPTKKDREETERSLVEFKRSHPELFGEVED